jgi:hypothetical protein
MTEPIIGPSPRATDIEAIQRELEATPLFMRSLPDDTSSNEQLDALQSLIFDEEPNGLSSDLSQVLYLSCIHCRAIIRLSRSAKFQRSRKRLF